MTSGKLRKLLIFLCFQSYRKKAFTTFVEALQNSKRKKLELKYVRYGAKVTSLTPPTPPPPLNHPPSLNVSFCLFTDLSMLEIIFVCSCC